jgi:hypothetical protein
LHYPNPYSSPNVRFKRLIVRGIISTQDYRMVELKRRYLRMSNNRPTPTMHFDHASLQPSLGINPRPTLDNQVAQRFSQSCPRALPGPGLCPFGGACHACPARVQAKLTVSQPNDPYEQEADRVAERVMTMPEPKVQRACPSCEDYTLQKKPLADQITPLVQRQEISKEEEEESVQTKPIHEGIQRQEESEEEEEPVQAKRENSKTSPGTFDLGARVRSLRGGGTALPPGTRHFFEERFGSDFGDVRVHSSPQASEAAKSAHAHAFTIGRDIVFGQGRYTPESQAGRSLLAHELTHVVQQTRPMERSDLQSHALMRSSEGEDPPGASSKSGASTGTQPLFIGSEFSTRSDDPSCAQATKGLGKIPPEVKCPDSEEDLGFTKPYYLFCIGSDVFSKPHTPTEILNFVREQPAQSHFVVHGYSSTDGTPADNLRLSCHRALRVAREIINDGVPSENIEIAQKGQTTQFGGLEENRRAVVLAIPPSDGTPVGENLPVTTRIEKEEVVERARGRLREGNYNLGADAYIKFWTCGKIKRISDAVDRMHVRFQGEPGLKNPGVEGTAEGIGTNVIVLSDAVLGSSNQDDCVTERLVDMAFHQMTLDTIGSFQLRHQGARYLLGLGGFNSCTIPGFNDPVLNQDPLANEAAPPCAEAPLPTRLQPPGGKPVRFEVDDPYDEVSSAKIRWEADYSRNRALIIVPGLPIFARSNVQGYGDPAELAQYEIGYMQTITQDETVVDYVSGHRLEYRVPVPIRDADRRPTKAPWFASEFVSIPDSAGQASSLMFKGIVTEVPLAYEDVEQGDRIQSGNVIDTATRNINFVNWLVARRRGSSPDHYATHFLKGCRFNFTQQVDVLGVKGKGTFDTRREDADDASQTVMQFGGQTPEDLNEHDYTIVTNPPPREKAGRVTPAEFMGMLREMIEGLDPPRLGLKHSPAAVRVYLDMETGRVALPESDPKSSFSPVTADSPNIPQKPLNDLAREVLIRARKRDFLGRPDKPAIVKRDPRNTTQSKYDYVTVHLDPSPDTPLIDRPGVREAMREMWRRTVADEERGDPRGHELTVYIQRNGQLRPLIGGIRRGSPPQVKELPDGSELITYPEKCGDNTPDPDNDTPLGGIHTHPNPPLGPSSMDRDVARDGSAKCGIQHYMINNDEVVRFGPTEADDTHLGERKKVLGE